MTDAVVYKLYSLPPLSTAANQQLAVSTGTIATCFDNLAPPCGCLHAVVHELLCSCANWRYRHLTGAPIGAIGPKGLMISHDEETHLFIGVAALHHHTCNLCILTQVLF